jgi:predicted aspartyl protease
MRAALVNMAAVAALTAGFAPASAQSGANNRLWRLYEQRDFFALADELPPAVSAASDRETYLRAATLAAFGNYAASGEFLRSLLRKPHDPGLEVDARILLMLDERTLFHYGDALSAVLPILQRPPANVSLGGVKNRVALLEAIADAPPQTVTRRDIRVSLPLDPHRNFKASLNGHPIAMTLDSGASFSVIPQAAARQAGLRIRHANYQLVTGSGAQASADIAVSDLDLGGIDVRNAVFLVVPDSALPPAGDGNAAGLLGYPVFSKLGAVTVARNGVIAFDATPQDSSAADRMEVWDGQTMMRITLAGSRLVCRLDTGANRTIFSEQDLSGGAQADGLSGVRTGRVQSISGVARTKFRAASSLQFQLANRQVKLAQAPVLTGGSDASAPDCNIGRDALEPFAAYTFDFQHMKFALE